jgi:hypothetical protein
MKYKYSDAPGQLNTDGRLKRPIIEVEISRGSQRRKFLALIDSGADQIIMPGDYPVDKAPMGRYIAGVSSERRHVGLSQQSNLPR